MKLSEELRGILNASHVKSEAFVIRTEGDRKREPRNYSTWCAKAVALIGSLPATLRSRAITVQMERKTPEEQVEQFRLHYPYPEIENLQRQAWRWAQDNLAAIKDSVPNLSFINRLRDNWEPLARIAEVAGGGWPDRCRLAATAFYESKPDEESARIILLEDLQELFRESEGEPLSTDQILASLNGTKIGAGVSGKTASRFQRSSWRGCSGISRSVQGRSDKATTRQRAIRLRIVSRNSDAICKKPNLSRHTRHKSTRIMN